MSGLELMVAARKAVPDLPVIVVTAYGGPDVTAALHGRSLVEYLEKPVRTDRLIAKIDRLLERGEGFSGSISLPMLPDLIQVYTLSQTTGALGIRRGGNSGTIWFDNGKIVHAICGNLAGEAAVYQLVSWQGGAFSLDTATRPERRTITASWQEVLLEGCRLLDEEGRDFAPFDDAEDDVASTQVAVPADFVPRAIAAGPAHSHRPARQLTISDSPANRIAMESQKPASMPEKRSMGVAEHLSHLATIEGFIGAAIFDGTTKSLLGTEPGASTLDLEAAVAGNVGVLGAIQSTLNDLRLEDSIADVVTRLGKQYHLIRPVSLKQGVFVYLVLDKSRGDLAMARLRLEEIGQLLAAETHC